MAIFDLLSSIMWLIGTMLFSAVEYKQCRLGIEFYDPNFNVRTSFEEYPEFWLMFKLQRVALQVQDFFLLSSGDIGLIIAYIAFSVVCLDGSSQNIRWKRLLKAAMMPPLILCVGSLICYFNDVKYLTLWAKWYSLVYIRNYNYDIAFLVYSFALLIPMIVFFTFTLYKLWTRDTPSYKTNINADSRPLRIMMNMIQALTLSNIICSISYLYIFQDAQIIQSDSMIYSYLYSITVSSKGFYHMIALWMSEYKIKEGKLHSNLSTSSTEPSIPTIEWTLNTLSV
ncbi:hypothetical protein HDV01_001474 [Terramyces sp. JEL0728]|nr:hypothetical protein HDV01_001474 [Terramyces sp. JEL0728]